MRRTVSWLAAAILLATAWPVPAAGAALTDMPGHWARPQVEAGVAAGYVAGYPDGTFRPNAPITRAEFYKLLGAAMRLEPAAVSTGFAEQARSPLHWSFAQRHVPAAVAGGLLYPSDYDGQLAPDTRITRREIVVAAVRALGKESLAGRNPVTLTAPDLAKYPQWLQNYAALAVSSRIVTGYEDGSLGLERNATRAEALVMVQRILDQVTVGLTAEAGPGDSTAVRHPAEGEPTWTVRESVISNGTVAQDYRLEAGAAGVTLKPAPGRAVWVAYQVSGNGVVGRLSRGKLTEVARYASRTPELLA
ncbi:MAG TPA: S-layer homology domain-containing protein, partial [Symbiobacteriaceae bacterium]|nr:S-layer homology domain-containing protein [Symbiobacteriaceae bacterium]